MDASSNRASLPQGGFTPIEPADAVDDRNAQAGALGETSKCVSSVRADRDIGEIAVAHSDQAVPATAHRRVLTPCTASGAVASECC